MEKKTRDMSGGWRMRVALARALFASPTLLLLVRRTAPRFRFKPKRRHVSRLTHTPSKDEPTNHLDLEACVWLARPSGFFRVHSKRPNFLQEGYLKEYKKCLVMVSHSQDFLNGVCTHIIWLTHGKLTYYTGNYDTYCKTVAENEIIQTKKYLKEQEGEAAPHLFCHLA
jgi:ATP-binding cassette subfamily F protein 2